MIRRNIKALNAGRIRPALALFAADATLAFPGHNSFAEEFRAADPGRETHISHRGSAEISRFLERYVQTGMQMIVEDVLVNGPPWNTRAAIRVHHWAPGPDGSDAYNNRAVLFVTTARAKIQAQEDYEDTVRLAAFDRTCPT